MRRKLAAAVVAVAGAGFAVGLSLSPGTHKPTRLNAGQCARGPTDGGRCFAGSGVDGGHRLRGRTYSTGPYVAGECDLFVCPVQP